MNTDLTIQIGKLPKITANFDEVKAAITEKLAQYDGIISDVAQAKADRAKLNRMAKTVDDRRKAVKNEYMQPYSDFEKQINELNKIITDCSAKIDAQIKAIESSEKEEKRKELEAFFNENNDILGLDFAVIFNDRWLNKTFDADEAKTQILEAIETARAESKTTAISLRLYVTKAQAKKLKDFLKTENIAYEGI